MRFKQKKQSLGHIIAPLSQTYNFKKFRRQNNKSFASRENFFRNLHIVLIFFQSLFLQTAEQQ